MKTSELVQVIQGLSPRNVLLILNFIIMTLPCGLLVMLFYKIKVLEHTGAITQSMLALAIAMPAFVWNFLATLVISLSHWIGRHYGEYAAPDASQIVRGAKISFFASSIITGLAMYSALAFSIFLQLTMRSFLIQLIWIEAWIMLMAILIGMLVAADGIKKKQFAERKSPKKVSFKIDLEDFGFNDGVSFEDGITIDNIMDNEKPRALENVTLASKIAVRKDYRQK